MKPQARPFSVELKSRRRPLQASHANWSTAIDEPSPDDVPSRDIRDDASATEADPTPLAAANRMFRALTNTATSAAASFAGAPAGVLAPKQEAAPDVSPVPGAAGQPRTGRILPSLLPTNPFEGAPEQNAAPKPRKRRPASKQPRLASSEIAISGVNGPFGADPRPELAEPAAPTTRMPRRRRAEKRVPAGERWKRRRLPKVLW
jgi:hypothetical protein